MGRSEGVTGCKGGNTPPLAPEDDTARTDGLVGDRALEAQVSLADDGGRCRALSACQACHAGLNGIGFGFEEYNAAGRYQRSEERR